MKPKAVLVVATEAGDRERIAGWLEEEGYDVYGCPGPTAPGYRCVGAKTGRCALARVSDVVVMDSALPGEDVGEGTTASELVTLYTSLGKPVVEIATLRRDTTPPADWVRWPASREDVVAAVRSRV